VNIKSKRFGEVVVSQEEIIKFKEGILGFEQCKSFCVVDPGDHTLILWLQSTTNPEICFPILEPQIFKSDYCPELMPTDMKSISLENPLDAKVYTILTIPSQIDQMSANLKAPIIINSKKCIGKQVVLQDNKLTVKHEMFKELRAAISSFQTSDDGRRTIAQMNPAPIKSFNPDLIGSDGEVYDQIITVNVSDLEADD